MNRNRSLFRALPLALLAGLLATLLTPSCASKAGQLTASEVAPLVDVVAGDLEDYLDAGLAPNGSALSPARAFQVRSAVVTLRNAFLVAQGEQPIPFPEFDGAPAARGGPSDVVDRGAAEETSGSGVEAADDR
ncbi:MAG: hypothetical protein AAFU73_23980 [Planctomycetota bacterium]